MKIIILVLIKFYRFYISPILVYLFGKGCRFQPTCSVYFYDSVEKYGAYKGSLKGIKRILKCHPFSKPAYDPA